MKLKSIEINGFKSFPDKVKLNFGGGITSIVGPNGSGKSNIVDATRWVLGEQSSKTLRGGKMEDVIFSGTESRRATGLSEVAITIENEDHTLPTEFTEVKITRRLYRSGESEYLLNGKGVRLKDVNELLMNTGLGRDGYSLIGQGKIAEVLSVKGEERRTIFEEAAGISKYRYRRLETERHLNSAEENLVRLRDILGELTARVEPLKLQSEKAKKFLEYSEERKTLEINVWLDSLDKTKDAVSKAEADYYTVTTQIDSTTQKVEDLEGEIEELYTLSSRVNIDIDEVMREIRRIEGEVGNVKSVVAVLKNDISHKEEAIVNIQKSLTGTETRISDFDERETALAESKAVLSQQIEVLKAEMEDTQKLIVTTDLSEADKLLLEKKSEVATLSDTITDLRIVIANLENNKHNQKQSAYRIAGELEAYKSKLSENEAKLEIYTAAIVENNQVIATNENVIFGYQKKLDVRTARLAEFTKDVQKLSIAHAEKNQRLHLITEMERNMEGFSGSVKAVINEKNRGRLNGIIGTVSSLIKVEGAHSLAIETALGGAMQNVVVENEEVAKAAINLLKSQNNGRATFLPLTTLRGGVMNESGLSGRKGFVGIAAALAQCDVRYRSIVENLLGRTVVVQTIDNAIAISKEFGYKFRIVTLDGQLVNAGGSFTGGSAAKTTGALSRKIEIEALEQETEKIVEQLQKAKSEAARLDSEIAEVRAGLEGAFAEQRTAREHNIKTESETVSLRENVENAKTSIAASLAELEKMEVLGKEQEQTIEKSRAGQKSAEERQSALEEELKSIEKETETENARLDTLLGENAARKLDIKSMENEISLILRQIEDTKSAKALYFNEKGDKQQEAERLTEEIRKIKETIQSEYSKERGMQELVQTSLEKQRSLAGKRDENEKKQNELRVSIREINSVRENLLKEGARLEGRKAAILADYDQIIAKLWDEYELTYSKAAELRTELASLSKANSRIVELKSKMKALGSVNVDSIEEYKDVKERYEFFTTQVADLEKSKEELQIAIKELTTMMKDIFAEQFVIITNKFKEVFTDLFGGGKANLELADPEDILESGIDIKVAPPGKLINNLSALSGGEQALVAIALYFAILSVRPSPFVILDEIDTALDEVNVSRLANYYKKYTDKTQLILITHRRGSMEVSDVLYGVTMQEKGVSKLLTINVNEVEEKIKMKVT